jgi:hypothetical protein
MLVAVFIDQYDRRNTCFDKSKKTRRVRVSTSRSGLCFGLHQRCHRTE